VILWRLNDSISEFWNFGSSDLGSIEFSDDAKLGLMIYKEVVQMAGEIDVLSHGSMHPDDHAVSLLMTKRNPGLILRNQQLYRYIVQWLELLSHRQCTWKLHIY